MTFVELFQTWFCLIINHLNICERLTPHLSSLPPPISIHGVLVLCASGRNCKLNKISDHSKMSRICTSFEIDSNDLLSSQPVSCKPIYNCGTSDHRSLAASLRCPRRRWAITSVACFCQAVFDLSSGELIFLTAFLFLLSASLTSSGRTSSGNCFPNRL